MINFDPLKSFFDSLAPMSTEQWEYFKTALEWKKFKKKEKLLRVGKTENYLHFLLRGSVAFFFYKDGKEICYELSYENEFVSSYRSFLTRKPSEFELIALENCITLSISHHRLNQLYEKAKIGERLGRLCAERLYTQKLDRELALLTQNAKERYLTLLKKSPKIVQRTPQKYIASYLGLSPESLSRIRKSIQNL